MRGLAQWISDYQVCHTHPVNRLIHHVCVPAIVFSLLGLLWLVSLPLTVTGSIISLNLAIVIVLPVMVYYFVLSWRLAIGMLLLLAVMFAGIYYLQTAGVLWQVSLVVFVVAWAGQFIGHMIEGKRPSFFEDLRFLLIGPLWVLVHAYEYLGVSVNESSRP